MKLNDAYILFEDVYISNVIDPSNAINQNLSITKLNHPKQVRVLNLR